MSASDRHLPDRRRLLGVALILVAVMMVAQGLYTQWQMQQQATCQADFNEDVVAVQSQRGDWADEDRSALNGMIFTVIDPTGSDEAKQQAVTDYVAGVRENDRKRRANPLPSEVDC